MRKALISVILFLTWFYCDTITTTTTTMQHIMITTSLNFVLFGLQISMQPIAHAKLSI